MSPALQREDVYKHFKFTPRTAVISIIGLFAFPASIYWVAANTDVRFEKMVCMCDAAHFSGTATVEVGRDKEGATVRRQTLGTHTRSRVD